MTFKFPTRDRAGGLGVAGLLVRDLGCWRRRRADRPNKGDTAWMLTSTALVLLMTIPGLALFYGGLVRTKNMLSVLTQVFSIVCIVTIIWVLYGYSLAFTTAAPQRLRRRLLQGLPGRRHARLHRRRRSRSASSSPELVYICFQMTFACITPALIVGAFAERMKFSAVVLFIPLWVTFVYFPIAHMVWYWAGPDAIGDAAKALAAATDDGQEGRAGRSSTRSWPTPARSSSGARSTSPAARSCTSTPASPAWSAR